MTREQQIQVLAEKLAHIEIPAGDGYPPVDIVMLGPVTRIATYLYENGVRVEEVSGERNSDD